MQPYFEPLPRDQTCAYCNGRSVAAPLPKPLDAIYCISLQEQPHRTRQAIAHFHRIGLCRHVTLYRPVRGKNGERAIWESHRALARHALENDRRCTLMLEDDVDFRQLWSKLAPRIERAIGALPTDWCAFYLGHIPFQAYFVRRDILRVRSACAHAYVASERLLTWLTDTEPFRPDVATWDRIGGSIDGALAGLPGMYALFPMAVLQRYLGDYRIDTRVDAQGRPRSWRDNDRWRYYLIFSGALVMQVLAVLLSPWHRLTLERDRQRDETWALQSAQLIRASKLFDDDYYLQCRPDVAAQEVNPLWHYLYHGAREGAAPCPLFDSNYYAAQCRNLDGENSLAHYLRGGVAISRNPHPLFDTAFYLSRCGCKIPQGITPLEHFLTTGGRTDPHPLFDTTWYLSRQPACRERRQNPLIHYLTEGWRQGAAPHPQFDGELYLRWNPDVKAAGVNPLDHFVRHGKAKGCAQPVPTPLHATDHRPSLQSDPAELL
jgi:hypothetical protein